MSSSSLAIAVATEVAGPLRLEAFIDDVPAPLNEPFPCSAGAHRVTLTLRLLLRDSMVAANTCHQVQLAPGSVMVLSPLAAFERLLTGELGLTA
ncbi:MAG TPA: hypothetical protein VF712_08885 [Thermoleophilaceae bacterium]